MKRFIGLALSLVLFAAPAFAGKKPPTVTIPMNVQVGSAQVPQGDYQLTWTGSGSNVQATLTQKGKAVATFPAKVVTGKGDPGVGTYAQGGHAFLESIQLNNLSLVLASAPHSGQE
jgi:hypothetical protein